MPFIPVGGFGFTPRGTRLSVNDGTLEDSSDDEARLKENAPNIEGFHSTDGEDHHDADGDDVIRLSVHHDRRGRPIPFRYLVIDASGLHIIDAAAVRFLKCLVVDYDKVNVRVLFAAATGELKLFLKTSNKTKV
jgi:hypothetical protein